MQNKLTFLSCTGDDLTQAIARGAIGELVSADKRYQLKIRPCTDEQLQEIIEGLVNYDLTRQVIELNLANNQLTTLPVAIGKLTALTGLNLYNNKLTTLPEAIGKLTALTELILSKNQLTTLPEAIGKLTALKWLNLNNNQLTTLPEAIGKLMALAALGLNRNQLTTLPISAIKWRDSNVTQNSVLAPLLDQLRIEAHLFAGIMQALIDTHCDHCEELVRLGKNNSMLEQYRAHIAGFKSVFFSRDLLTRIFQFVSVNDKQVTSPYSQFGRFFKPLEFLPTVDEPNRRPVVEVLERDEDDVGLIANLQASLQNLFSWPSKPS